MVHRTGELHLRSFCHLSGSRQGKARARKGCVRLSRETCGDANEREWFLPQCSCQPTLTAQPQALKVGNLVSWTVTDWILVILRSEALFDGRYYAAATCIILLHPPTICNSSNMSFTRQHLFKHFLLIFCAFTSRNMWGSTFCAWEVLTSFRYSFISLSCISDILLEKIACILFSFRTLICFSSFWQLNHEISESERTQNILYTLNKDSEFIYECVWTSQCLPPFWRTTVLTFSSHL